MTAAATPPALSTAEPHATRFAHRPGLDGLRGVAVAGVLVFHSDLRTDAGDLLVPGGFLGVSAFFTLSGFLITTLLLRERAATGAVALGAFWSRRARRLLPASVAGIVLAGLIVATAGDPSTIERFPVDALAALGNVANWRFVLSDLSYADLFSADSPLQHYWSLAIEEQCYLLLPLVVAFLGRQRSAAAHRVRVAAAATTGITLSVLASMVTAGDRAYYGTDVRAAELLVGVVLACAVDAGLHGHIPLRVRHWAATTSVIVIGIAWFVVDQDADALHPWILLGHAVATAVIIVALLGRGRLARMFSLAPLTALGRVSYGVYVFHWPLFGLLDTDRTGLDGAALFGVRLAATGALAAISARLLEQPIRHRRWPRPGRAGIRLAIGALAATAVLAVVVGTVDRQGEVDFAGAEAVADDLGAVSTPPTTARSEGASTTSSTTSTPAAAAVPDPALPPIPPTPRIALFGDSTAFILLPAFIEAADERGDFVPVAGAAFEGCGLIRRGDVRRIDGELVPVPEGCDFSTTWIDTVRAHGPDIIVVQIGLWDLVDRRLHGDDHVTTLGDPVFDTILRSELATLADLLSPEVARIVFVLQPPPVRSSRPSGDQVFDRMPVFNRFLVDAYLDDPRVGLVDLDTWLRDRGDVESTEVRPDGTHFSVDDAPAAVDFLLDAVLVAADDTITIIGPDRLPSPDPPDATTP